MDTRNEKNDIFNFKLAKHTGLYQMIDPGTVQFRGQNIYHIVLVCVLIYMGLITITMYLSYLYNLTVNIPLGIDFFWKSAIDAFVFYKAWFVVCHSDDIWNCLSITRYDFSSLNIQNTHILDRRRKNVLWLTNMYSMIILFLTILFLLCPFILRTEFILAKSHDGSIGYYRENIINLYVIVSDETYNAHYYTFYFVEAFYAALAIFIYAMFDVLLLSLCNGISCQMEIICSAFKSVGHKLLRDTHSPTNNQDENKNITPNEQNVLIYEELKKIIVEHQAVLEKYEDFLTLFRSMILLQIFVSSISVILICFIFMMCFSNVEIFKASSTTLIRLFCIIPPVFLQIFMICYLYGNIHDQKDSIIFALYSSNWTEMDMKCKKLILLTMEMNNANNKKLKFTRTKIVNLEMFFKTMSDCYTVISVLMNYIQQNVD